jgi:hypothetical protein
MNDVMLSLTKRAVAGCVLGTALALACSWAVMGVDGCAAVPAITSAVVQEVQCVESEVSKGDTTFEDIAAACAPIAVADVVTIVTSLLVSDSGDLAAKAKAVHHKASAK